MPGPGPPGEPRADPAAFFDSLLQTHHRAEAAVGGPTARFYRVAGHVLCLRLAGPALLDPVGAALAHLACDPVLRPGLTVHVWDLSSTGQAPPPPPWSPEDLRQAGVVRGFSDARFHTVLQVGSGLFTMLDRAQDRAVAWVRDAREIPMAERVAPLRRLLPAWLAGRGVVLVHAGAVGRADGGVLLVGAGGAGKSNAALACLGTPLRFASDDYCLVDITGPPRAHSLYSTAKTHAEDLGRLTFLAPMVENPDRLGQEKAAYFLHRHVPEQLTAGFPLRAALLVRVSERTETTVSPVPRGAVLQALAPTTVLLGAQWGAWALAGLGRLVQGLPAHELRTGTDPGQIPRAILDLLARP
jgi:hypothetical protein